MKSSAMLAACGAILAAASPILQERRLIVHSKVVIEWVTVTVTEGEQPTPAVFSVARRPAQRTTTTTIATTTSAAPPPPPPPPPAPSTSAAPEPVVVVEPAPKPEPATQAPPPVVEAPAPVVESPAPVVEAPAPVVEAPVPAVSTQAPASAPAPAPAPVKVEASSDYQKAVLESHNVHRFNHSAGALEWGQQYADSAKVLAQRCKFEHDTSINGGGYGQNLAMWAASANVDKVDPAAAAARAISNGWYNDELELFPASEYGRANPSAQAQATFSKWGHFTQLVWKDSKQVGCFTARCPVGTLVSNMESLYTVCNYFPVGNMGGAYGKNVLPPLGQPISIAA